MAESAPAERRAAAAAACLLTVAVLAGAILLGAPPRFSAGATGPETLRRVLTTLTPLALIEVAVALSLGALVAAECLRRESPGLPGGRAAARIRLPLLALFALGLVQLVPLPVGVLRAVAPHAADTYASLAASGDDTLRPMSLWPAGTVHALFTLGGVIAASTLVFALVRGDGARRAAAFVLGAVALFAAGEAILGLAATKLGDDRLLGTFEKVSGRGRVTGTFIHGTMLAVWAGMGAAAATGLAAASARRGVRVLFVGVALVAAVAGVLSLSRLGCAGIAVGGAAAAVLAGRALARSGSRVAGRAVMLGAVLFAAAAVATAFLLPAFRERVDYLLAGGSAVSAEPRIAIFRSTWDLFLASPVTGTGLGSFGRAIHLTQSPDCAQELWFAHSDPLNLLSDAGVIGFALGAAWLVMILRAGLPALRSADVGVSGLAAGAFGAAVVVVTASLGDFQTQFPVVAIPFAALVSVPAALATATARDEKEPRAWIVPSRALAAFALVVAAAAAMVPAAACASRWSDLAGEGVTGATRSEALVASARTLLARVPSSPDPRKELLAAESRLREAARIDPLLDETHLWTGLAAHALGQSKDDVYRALGRARLVARGRAQTNLVAGRTYLDLAGTGPVPYGPPGDTAIAALREAGEIEPKAFSAAWKACADRGLGVDALRAVTPLRSYAQAFLADHLTSLGRADEAMVVLEDQLGRDPADEGVRRRLARAYVERGRSSDGRELFDRLGAVWPEGN